MTRKISTIVFFLLLSVQSAIFSQVKPDGQKAWQHVNYLASDQFKGRKAGTPEYRKAAEYVAAKMKEYGLQPGGENGSYFQEVTFKDWKNFEQPIRLEIRSPEHRVYFAGRNRDFIPAARTGSGTVTSQPVFAGFGIIADEQNWNDYENIDAKGKIVLLIPEIPDSVLKPAAPDTLKGKQRRNWLINQRLKTAVAQGAAGVIWMNISPTGIRWNRRSPIEKGVCPKDFVVMVANRSFLDDLFYLSHQSWKYLVSKTLREKRSFTTSLDATVEMEAHYTEIDSLTAPNVIGLLPGRHRKLKHEYLILGGHLDHLGVGADGFIYNGADDNAGSVGTILEIARVMQANKFRPDRSLVFACWAGEELGLIGSKYYVNHPIYPLEKTDAYLNMDMIGCGDSDLYVGGMWEFSDFYDIIKTRLDEQIKKKLRYRLNYRGSDHSAFLPKGITAISLRTGNILTRRLDDEHPEYHCPGDDPQIIDPDLLQLSARYYYNILTNLSKTKANLLDPKYHINFVHKDATVVDLHCDTIGRFLKGEDLTRDNATGHIDIPKLKRGAVDLQVFACFVPPPGNETEKNNAARLAFQQIDGIYRLVEQNPNDLAIVKSYRDLRQLKGTAKTGILIGIEGGYAIEDDLSLLRSFYRAGVRLMTLTHWTHTDWADASGDEKVSFCGLTDFGEKVVKEMNRLGMIIDISHVHDETFWDVMRITDSPVVASHSCCRALSDHHRNMSDKMLKALAKNGGVIGINYYPGFLNADYDQQREELRAEIAKKYNLPADFLALEQVDPEKLKKFQQEFDASWQQAKKKLPPVDVKTVVDHIEHVIKVTGSTDHVALGSDFDGISITPTGLENVGKLPNITRELMKRGYKEEDIRKILGGNFIRVFKEITEGRKK